MNIDDLHVLFVGSSGEHRHELDDSDGFTVTQIDSLDDVAAPVEADAVVLAMDDMRPLEAVRDARAAAPEAAILVITDAAHDAEGAIALHAGAEEHLFSSDLLPGILARAVRYGVAMRRLRRELATVDEETGMPNLRGFAPIADHHLRMADRAQTPVVFVFVRLDDHASAQSEDPEVATKLALDASGVLLEAVRDADVPARIAPDTFCVLLTGSAEGAESLVLSRLVEAIAVHDARQDRPRSLALSVGSALYEPKSGATLATILEAAGRRLSAGAPDRA
jgi:diguanylate cyclase (GGDEF)-like protein